MDNKERSPKIFDGIMDNIKMISRTRKAADLIKTLTEMNYKDTKEKENS